ncbi:MAG: endonuclease Q family protein [Candidatus Omnitrophota bacterium]
MEFIADFHIHSKYSRATSRDMDIENIAKWANIKGIQLIGTGDFTHHLWLQELKSKLEPLDNGLFTYNNVNFILTAEISSIYSKRGKTYRIHNIIFAPSFKIVEKINQALIRYGANLTSDGRPIIGMDAKNLAKLVFDIDENCMVIPGHAWTPWFSVFGSMSGFDRLEDCFEELTPKIFSIETGLSSDPQMNWRLSALDKITLISNSDSHSPAKIGREANVFDCELNYKTIRDVLKTKDKKRFLYTIEFFPEEGKYHFDGHRNCGVCFSPQEAKKHKNICPKCGRLLTIGVMNRVDQLADRPEGFIPHNSIPYKNLIPLEEIIADVLDVAPQSKTVEKEYFNTIAKFHTEFNCLLKASEEDLIENLPEKQAKAIIAVRAGLVKLQPGYDGEYGKIQVLIQEKLKNKTNKEEQLNLF